MELKINIPESLNDIPLKNYQKFLQKEEQGDLDILECFYGIKHKDLFEIKHNDAKELIDAVNKCFEKPNNNLITSFKLKGVKYGFIPKLDDMTYGENIDLTRYISDPEKLHNAMAVMYRPITKMQFGKYLIEPYKGSEKYAEVMQDVPVSVYLSAQVFFYNLTNDLLKAIPAYLKEESQHLTAENGEAIRHYTNLLTENLRKLERLQNTTYTKQ